MEDVNSLGYFLHGLNTSVLQIIVVLWIPNSLTSLANFSFSLDFLKTCPWWYATLIIPFLFLLIISSYRSIIITAFPGLVPLLLLCLDCQILQSHLYWWNPIISFLSLLLINVSPFYYLSHLSTSINKTINTLVPNLIQKIFI